MNWKGREPAWRDWPVYSAQCRRDIQRLLKDGTRLTAYRANPAHGSGPSHGSWAWKLEREAERVHQVPHVIACANGTIALEVLLKCLYSDGGEVITSALTFSATVAAILRAGLRPVFADVEIHNGLLSEESVNRMTTKKTMGVLYVDLFGRQAAAPHVVDACQSVGLSPLALHGVWSFNGRKNVPAGEAGAIFTDVPEIDKKARLHLGHAENFRNVDWVGGNGHLNEVTACIAYHGMRKVKQRNAHRVKMAKVLNNELSCTNRVQTPNLTNHALYMYPLIVETGMERIADTLYTRGVECQRGYIQPPLHQYPAFSRIRRDALLNTEALSRDRLLLFPQVTPTATRQEMERLGEQIRMALP